MDGKFTRKKRRKEKERMKNYQVRETEKKENTTTTKVNNVSVIQIDFVLFSQT